MPVCLALGGNSAKLISVPTPSPLPPAPSGTRGKRTLAALALLLLLFAALALVAARATLRSHLQALAVLDQVSGATPSRTLQHLVAEPVHLQDIVIPTSADLPVRARLYLPVHHPNGPVLLVFHGVHHLGVDEPASSPLLVP